MENEKKDSKLAVKVIMTCTLEEEAKRRKKRISARRQEKNSFHVLQLNIVPYGNKQVNKIYSCCFIHNNTYGSHQPMTSQIKSYLKKNAEN